MKGYKGFDKDLMSGNVSYEIGKTYDANSAAGEEDFHACENPLDVFTYSAPADSRYCEVELEGTGARQEDTGRVGSRMTILGEVGLPEMIEAGAAYIKKQVDWENSKESAEGDFASANANDIHSAAVCSGKGSASSVGGYQSVAVNSGYQSAATATGDVSSATATGYQSAATCLGDGSAAICSEVRSAAICTGARSAATGKGEGSAAVTSGYQSAAVNSGYQSVAVCTGYQSAAISSGDHSAAASVGSRSAAAVSGKGAIAAALGMLSKAKGALGCWIVVAEWEQDEKSEYHLKEVKTAKVDGVILKPDVYYTLKDGEFVEA